MMQLQEEEMRSGKSEGWRQEMPGMFQDRNRGHLRTEIETGTGLSVGQEG